MARKILVVEDNYDNREIVCEELEYNGYQVLQAVNGQEGLEMALSDKPDLILMDMAMPVLDGWQTTRRLKDDPRTHRIPVIAVTAYAMSGDRERALSAGCDGYIAKPCDPEEVVARVSEQLAVISEQ